MVLGGEGYSRIRPTPAWPRGAAWRCLDCHVDPVAWGCGRAGPRGPAAQWDRGQRCCYTSVAGPHS